MLLLFAQAMREAQAARAIPDDEWISPDLFREFIGRVLENAEQAVSHGWVHQAAVRKLVEVRTSDGQVRFRLTRRGHRIARPFS